MLPSLQPRLQLSWQSQPPKLQSSDENQPFSKPEQVLMDIRNQYNFADFSIPSFCRWASQRRRRSIQMLPRRLAPGIYGVWIMYGEEDLIFYDDKAEGIYLTHIQLHELAHLLCGHRTMDALQAINLGFPSLLEWIYGKKKTLPVEIESQLSQILLRTNHDRQKCEEAEAEALTELIMSEIFGVQQISQMTVAPRNMSIKERQKTQKKYPLKEREKVSDLPPRGRGSFAIKKESRFIGWGAIWKRGRVNPNRGW